MPVTIVTAPSDAGENLAPAPHHSHAATTDNKENIPCEADIDTRKDSPCNDNEDSRVQSADLSFPQTPGQRIAFADLIANPEDALNRQISATPNEQVEWKHAPSSSSVTRSARLSQRGTKRAHSSSPISSQEHRQRHHRGGDKGALDLDSIGRSLRTPRQDDPALALWDRYADYHEHDEREGPLLPQLPPLSSSPHTPGSVRRYDSIRRTASCGIEWPVSASKRRKLLVRDPHMRAKGIFAAHKGMILGKGHSRHSRVGMLVDVIHQSLAEKVAAPAALPSSSSPIPERTASMSASPVKAGVAVASPTKPSDDRKGPKDLHPSHDDESSDYGEMDFDLEDPDLLDVLQQAGSQDNVSHIRLPMNPPQPSANTTGMGGVSSAPQPHLPEKAPLDRTMETIWELDNHHQSPNLPRDSERKAIHGSHSQSVEGFEEFDEADDSFMTELAVLANKVDSQDQSTLCSRKDASIKEPSACEFDDVFDDDDDIDNESSEFWRAVDSTAAPCDQQVVGPTSQQSKDNRSIKRYLIMQVVEGQYETVHGQKRSEKTLSIKDERTRHMYLISLRQSWYDTRCTKGSYVHLIGDFDVQGRCIVDDKSNMVILHPDHLISATVVADSFTCTRRAILQDRIKATNPAEPPQVYGHLLHEVFGEALKQNKWSMGDLRQIIQQLIPTHIEALYEIGVQPQDALEYAMSKMPELTAWASIFVTPSISSGAVIRDRKGALVPMAITKLLELEEHVWSPMYGLKGNIDATVQAKMQFPSERSAWTLTVPLELKTGKRDSNEMHRAQTALYTLLLSDRYDINVTSGILYYLETSKTFRVEGVRNEIRHMIIQRNELACYVHDKLALPPMIKKEHLCKKCYAQTSCFTYHKLVEGGDHESSGMKEIFTDAVGHLKPVHQEFFKKWDDLLTKEERDAMKFRRELWTMVGAEREALGRCFANVVIEPGSAVENSNSPKINRYSYSFTKLKPKPGFSFAESQITIGEPIVISDEKGHFALANGYVTNVRPARITVAVDRRLQDARIKQAGFDAEFNQVFTGVTGLHNTNELALSGNAIPTTYRIDKDEFASGMATARNNVLRIMEKDLFRARELRQLIVENKSPVFKHTSTAYTLSGPASQQQINIDQKRAIEKVMTAKDYALVLGMPGTGKTTTIAHIIRALVSQGKSVLLTSYTHTAVDNILLKIKDDGIPILRLGALGKVHPGVQKFADLSGIPKKTIAELERSWSTSKVVATTCLGINHAIFNHRKFDYCIVDEASQITLPVCLGPIRLASTFILVGDHYQLPPLVQNQEAQQGGLDISLFKLLSDGQPGSVVNLEHQYRMAEDIMILSNLLVYNGRLKCGTPQVASRQLKIPDLEAGLEAHHYSAFVLAHDTQRANVCVQSPNTACWLKTALSPEHRTLLLDTDNVTLDNGLVNARETVSGSGMRITNVIEALLTAQILTALIRSGVAPASIGVITFYRSQLALLKSTIKSMTGTRAAADVEIHTADKYQGRDKEVILLSCVRSNESSNVGELLKDWRRVNVALTRARSKLVIIGSAKTMKGSRVPVLEGLVRIVQQRGWLLNLPVHAAMDHFFEGSSTQTQTQNQQQHYHRHHQHARSSTLDSGKVGTASGHHRSPNKASTKMKQSSTKDRIPLSNLENGSNSRAARKPSKVFNGLANAAETLLEKRPILRHIYDEEVFVSDQEVLT